MGGGRGEETALALTTHHPLGNDDVDVFGGQLNLLDLAADQRDAIAES